MTSGPRNEPTSLASMSGALAETLERHYGVDPRPLYVRAGLDPGMIGKAGARYPFCALRKLWQEAAEATGDPCLGLVVGRHLRPGNTQVLGFAWLASSTLEEALDRWLRYHRVASTAAVFRRRVEHDLAVYSFDAARGVNPLPVMLGEASLAALVAMCRRASTEDFSPLWVRLRRPDPGQRIRYEEWFQAPVEFGAAENAIALKIVDIRQPLPAGNPELAGAADKWLARMLVQVDEAEVVGQVRELLTQLLSSGHATEREIASRLNRSVSSLQRDLRKEGTSFRTLLEETRHRLAEKLLSGEGRSIGQVAFLLGYSDQSTFTRAFRRWTGRSPGQYLREEAGGVAPPA
jgi:AraC-like DNA-binding protein